MTEKQTEVDQLIERVRDLESEYAQARSTQRNLRSARNRLALLTASLFVVVDDGERAVVYGAVGDIESCGSRLSITLNANGSAVVSSYVEGSAVRIFLSAGEKIQFVLEDSKEGPRYFHVHTFSSFKDANEWAALRQEVYTQHP